MKMHNFVLFGVVFSAVAVYGEPIDLGCHVHGPLAALNSSAAFREVIGAANPANFLSSVYDVNGQQLTPGSFKALQCPLFIDSNAKPSASASNAILRAEGNARVKAPEEQTTAAVQDQPFMVLAATGVVAQFLQPELQKAETQEGPQAAPKAETSRARNTRGRALASGLVPENQQLTRKISKPRREWTVHALAAPRPKDVNVERAQISSVARSQNSPVLSFAEAIGLARPSRTGDSTALLESNPIMVLFDFVGSLAAVLGLCLLVVHQGRRAFGVRTKLELYRAALNRLDLRTLEPNRVTSRRALSVSGSGNSEIVSKWPLRGLANSR